MHIEVFSRRNALGLKRWYFRVKAENNRIVAQSESYINRGDCLQTAQAMAYGLGPASKIIFV